MLPKLIFVSCRSFPLFYHHVYPRIPAHHAYVLIVGDEDCTIPNSLDRRYAKDYAMTPAMWRDIVGNPQVLHIYCTHLDIPASDKYSPLPVGFNPEEHPHTDVDHLLTMKVDLDIMNRPLTVKGCCRIRGHAQWEDRRIVKRLCETTCWASFADWGSIPRADFFTEIQKYSFLLCPHGGGIDPNPKVFSAIYAGTIPIIKKFVNCELLYGDMPVVVVDDWVEDCITVDKMRRWKSELKPYFVDGNKRRKVVEKLTSKFWLDRIRRKLRDGLRNYRHGADGD